MTLPENATVLGIHVGTSTASRTAAVCRLDWDACQIRFQIERFRPRKPEWGSILARVAGDAEILCAAFDGPVLPASDIMGRYRAAERVFHLAHARRPFYQVRPIGMPPQGSSAEGLQRSARTLEAVSALLDVADLGPSLHAHGISDRSVVETFPSGFLGLLMEWRAFCDLGWDRRKVNMGAFWRHLAAQDGFVPLFRTILPERVVPDFTTIVERGDREALTCALAALCVAGGSYSAVGDGDGWIILPPRALSLDILSYDRILIDGARGPEDGQWIGQGPGPTEVRKDARRAIAAQIATEADLPDVLKPWMQPLVSGPRGQRAKLPAFWNADLYPAPRLVDGKPIPARAVDALGTILAASVRAGTSPLLDLARQALEPSSLAAFASAICQHWADRNRDIRSQGAAGDAASNWMARSVAVVGDDQAVADLFTKFRRRASPLHAIDTALDILGTIGSDTAVAGLQAFAIENPSLRARDRALSLINEIAARRGLSKEQLEDLAVPTLGLSAAGEIRLETGSGDCFVSVDARLNPQLRLGDGRVVKAPPRPSKGDGPAIGRRAASQWAEFRKALKPHARLQLRRLEQAMVHERRWSLPAFRRHLVGSPLLQVTARSLVWALHPADNTKAFTPFRVMADGEFVDVDGSRLQVPEDSQVSLVHPLHLGSGTEAWRAVLSALRLEQPFPQVLRQVFRFPERDVEPDWCGTQAAQPGACHGLISSILPNGAVMGLISHGWSAGVGDAGLVWDLSKVFGKERIEVEPGGMLSIGGHNYEDNPIERIRWTNGLPETLFSEAIRDLKMAVR